MHTHSIVACTFESDLACYYLSLLNLQLEEKMWSKSVGHYPSTVCASIKCFLLSMMTFQLGCLASRSKNIINNSFPIQFRVEGRWETTKVMACVPININVRYGHKRMYITSNMNWSVMVTSNHYEILRSVICNMLVFL